ncbi:hypothetical protein GSF22_33990, partial [Micromonospora echinofusca]|nr:hypothetical protein [Micromonospora echinofusca]
MRLTSGALLLVLGVTAALLPGCGRSPGPAVPAPVPTTAGAAPDLAGSAGMGAVPTGRPTPTVRATGGTLQAGNPAGRATVPAEARAVDTSRPTRVVGTGTPASCTSAAVVRAVAAGGIVTFDCGPAPVTIRMQATAKIRNAAGPRIVLDGGGLVTLSGGGERRILYMNTCDRAQGWTTSHCDNQDHPQLTVQNLTFADGNSTG